MIKLTSVHKSFGSQKVIKDVSISIEPGEIIGFLGPNGAGKTTTVRMIAGVLPPSKGTVTINGIDIFNESANYTPHIGYLPENNPIYDDLTVEEFLIHWAALKNIPQNKVKEQIDEAVKLAGLSEVYYRPISELSKGFKQRTGLAQAILSQPDILLLDEPTEGLDPNQRADIHKLIKGLEKKRTVIICSHVLPEITRMCNRVIIIHEGKIVADSPTNKLGSLSKGGNTYSILATGKSIEKDLKSLKPVQKISKTKEDPAIRFEIITDTDKDLRLEIFKLAKKQNWKLYELTQKQQDLEDVFTKLTNKNNN